MELFGLGVLLVIALGVILGIVILLTRGVFARDLTQALKRVNQQEQSLQEKADLLEQRLSQMEREYHVKLKRAEAEADQVLQEAKTQAMNIRTAAIEEAKHRARQLLLEAEQGKLHLRAEVAKELNGQAVQQACTSLRTLLPASALAALHAGLVAELLEALRHMNVAGARPSLEHIVVATGQPFTETEHRHLVQWAAKAFGRPVAVDVKTEPTLIAGCVVEFGATIVDNSLPHRLSSP